MSLDRGDATESFAPKLVGGSLRHSASSAETPNAFLTDLLQTTAVSAGPKSAFEADFATAVAISEQRSADRWSPWARCLHALIRDFSERKSEIQLLNPGRRNQIETHIARLGGMEKNCSLDQILRARPDSPEELGFRAFANETAIFQLFQFLLLKRWLDLKFAEPEILRDAATKLNWQIQAILKASPAMRGLGRQPWSFLKINMYSWYKPSPITWDFLLKTTEKHDLSAEAGDFLGTILDDGSVFAENKIPFSTPSVYSTLAWEILLQQKCSDESVENVNALQIGKGSTNSVFVIGSAGGQALTTLHALANEAQLEGVYGFARSNFELFIAEINLLWGLAKNPVGICPMISMDRLRETNSSRANNRLLPAEEPRLPLEAGHVVCFPDQNRKGIEITDSMLALSRLRENGSLLIASDEFWITDRTELAQQMRTECLAHSSLRLIVDLRHLTFDLGPKFPKCFFILEKHPSKEMRDNNRPKIIKARGHAKNLEGLEEIWQLVLDCIPIKDNPGEVKMFQLGSTENRVRIEVMSAATTQAHLGTSPWASLSEPSFYQITSKLKLYPHKLHQEGFLLRPQKSAGIPLKKGVHFLEIPGLGLFAEADAASESLAKSAAATAFPKATPHFFLPEMTLSESPAFYAAMINSSAIQFWYRLEWEQISFGASRRGSRPADSTLKLMPLARIFPPSSMIPVEKLRSSVLLDLSFAEVEARRLTSLLENRDQRLQEAFELHKLIIDLEATIDFHLAITREYSKHLFPQFQAWRWNVPEQLPEISAADALCTLQHLQHAPLRQHPSIQCSYMKNVSDFKVTDHKLHIGQTGIAEMILFCGPEAMMRVQGPTLLLQAAATHVQRRLQRPWSEIAQKISFPIDTSLMLKQLEEFVRLTKEELAKASLAAKLSDFIFCRLFGLSTDSPNSGDAFIIRSHLDPQAATVTLGNRHKNIFARSTLVATLPAKGAAEPIALR